MKVQSFFLEEAIIIICSSNLKIALELCTISTYHWFPKTENCHVWRSRLLRARAQCQLLKVRGSGLGGETRWTSFCATGMAQEEGTEEEYES